MPTGSRAGKDWSKGELDLVVGDYFRMLQAEQTGQAYNKALHRRELMRTIDRTNASIEFKRRNISAVLTLLGLPYLSGYLPAQNYQAALFDSIGNYLALNPDPVPFTALPAVALSESQSLFEGSPPTAKTDKLYNAVALQHLIGKFDPAARDQLNRSLGRAGEECIFEFERQQLTQHDRPDLARKVRWVSQEDGDGAGYDILSFDRFGQKKLIEVKTTRGSSLTPFYLTRNENDVARQHPEFRLYRLYDFSRRPGLFTLTPPLEPILRLEAMTFRASLR